MDMVMNRPDVLFHATKLINVDKILTEGLKINEPKSLISHKVFNRPGVYLSRIRFDWMDWVTIAHQHKGAVIAIDTDGLILLPDNDMMVMNSVSNSVEDRSYNDFLCPHNIGREHIIAVDREQLDHSFKEQIISKDLYNKHKILLEGKRIK